MCFKMPRHRGKGYARDHRKQPALVLLLVLCVVFAWFVDKTL